LALKSTSRTGILQSSTTSLLSPKGMSHTTNAIFYSQKGWSQL
jgi:hypothetical protein